MKKLLRVVLLLVCMSMIGGCGGKAKKILDNEEVLNKFPTMQKEVLKDANPDLVDMNYLVKHAKDYVVELPTDRNDYFVVVRGVVERVETSSYDEETIDSLDMDEYGKSLLRNTTYRDIYFEGCDTPLPDNYNKNDEVKEYEEGKEYYFYVIVTELLDEYNYKIFESFLF